MKPLLNCKQTASFNLYFVKINFSTGVGGSLSYFVEIPEGWGGGSSVPYKYGKSRDVGGS